MFKGNGKNCLVQHHRQEGHSLYNKTSWVPLPVAKISSSMDYPTVTHAPSCCLYKLWLLGNDHQGCVYNIMMWPTERFSYNEAIVVTYFVIVWYMYKGGGGVSFVVTGDTEMTQ